MALRQVTASDGTRWAVLEIKGETARSGWLQFVAGRSRRRLSPVPKSSQQLADPEREALLPQSKRTPSAPE